jgi:hypothetical protein
MSTSQWMNALAAVVVLAPVTLVATQCTDAARADQISTTLTPEALKEIVQVEAESIASRPKRSSGWPHRRIIKSSKSSSSASSCCMTSISQ